MKKHSDGRGTQFSTPAYRRIEMDLRDKIKQGHWAAGAMLPSRKDLASEYGVSVPTMERAVSDLLEDGTLRADGGRGTFVATPARAERPQLQEAISSNGPAARGVTMSASDPLIAAPQMAAVGTIGVICFVDRTNDGARSSEDWNNTVVNSIERSITRAGGSTLFFNLSQPDGTRASLETAIRSLVADGAKAVAVVFEVDQEEIANVGSSTELHSIPIVFIASEEIFHPVLSVYYDSRQAGYQAAFHLIQRGCRDLMFFAPYTSDWVTQRAAGVRDASQLSGRPESALQLAISPAPMDAVLKIHDHSDAAFATARELIARKQLPDGIIAANDHVAYGFIKAATEAGLTVGRDYVIVGFDDGSESRELAITTLRPPLAGLGEEAAKLILRALHGEETGMHICLHSHLVARSSSRFAVK